MLRSAVCSVLVIALFAIVGSATEITGVIWDPDMNVIHITLDAWPGNWGGGWRPDVVVLNLRLRLPKLTGDEDRLR
jgi:hypothetical protein